ncbi:MAG: lipopolysaccharide biosynthesis protein [Parabacteroides sp.]|nr:lipopolysaccharide biosynthesis protein [Parabacteroides sp.]
MSEQTLKEKTAKGLFLGGISNGVQQMLGVLFGIYLARILNAEDYGLISMLAIFSGIAGTLINSGFSVALTNKQDATHKDYNAVFWFTFFVGLFCYMALFLAAPLIAKFYDRPELTSLSRIIFVSFFINGCSVVSYTILFKKLMVKQQAQIDIVSMLLSGIVGVTLAMKEYAYWALALQNVTFICSSALLRFYLVPWKPTFSIDFTPLKGMFSFSVKLFFTNIFQQINNNLFSVLLGRFYNATQVGYFSQGQKWAVMGSQSICGMFCAVVQPVFVEVSGDKERELKVFRKMSRFGAFVSIPVMFGLAFVAKEFIFIALGNKWLPSVMILQILCIWGGFLFLQTLYTQILIVHGRSDIYLRGNIFQGVLQFLSVIIAFHWGILIMVGVYVLAFFISFFFWHFYVHKVIGLNLKMIVLDIGTYLSIALITFLIVYLFLLCITNVYLLLCLKVLLFAVIYLALVYALGSNIIKESILYIRGK